MPADTANVLLWAIIAIGMLVSVFGVALMIIAWKFSDLAAQPNTAISDDDLDELINGDEGLKDEF